jgi:hypothetical protein
MAVETTEARPRRGVSLAKGPVALIGLASLVLGLLGLIFASQNFTWDFPSGTVNGGTFIGIEGNGWTWLAFVAGGLLLLLGAPLHWGAKSMAFVVGIAYGVGALIALSDGSDILGIFATNMWTKLVLGIGGAALVLLSMMPRVGTRRGSAPGTVHRDDTVADEPDRFGRESVVEREPVSPNGTTTTHTGTLDDRRQIKRDCTPLDKRGQSPFK